MGEDKRWEGRTHKDVLPCADAMMDPALAKRELLAHGMLCGALLANLSRA